MTDWLDEFPHCRHSVGGSIHPTAIIGAPPELREWKPGDATFAPRIHRTARIHAYVTIDAGSHEATEVGARTWLMKHVHIGHDTVLGEDVEIAPGVVICGDVVIEDRVHIGVNASVKHGVTIGEGAVIGAGAVVIRDVPAGEVHAGNPAHLIGAACATSR